MADFKDLITPELLVLVPVLYIIGIGLKQSNTVNDRYIPFILGVGGVFLACLYILGTQGFGVMQLFTGITQGILCAGCSVYVNQLSKQYKKNE